MRRIVVAGLVLLLCIAIAQVAFAEIKTHPYKEFFFGDSFHKSPAGVKLNYLELKYDKRGAYEFNFEFSAWKGKVVWDDMLFVCNCPEKGKPQITWKLSSKKKMGKEFCYLDCLHKAYRDRLIIEPPAKPFDGETGQVWYIVRHGGQGYHIVWDLKSNTIEWFKAEDKPVPTDCAPTCPNMK
jgi:hypothetical protein